MARIELPPDLKRAFACTDAEQQLAVALADLVFSEAEEGVRPLVYLELAARILAKTATMAIDHQNKVGAAQLDVRSGASTMASYAADRAVQLIAGDENSA